MEKPNNQWGILEITKFFVCTNLFSAFVVSASVVAVVVGAGGAADVVVVVAVVVVVVHG